MTEKLRAVSGDEVGPGCPKCKARNTGSPELMTGLCSGCGRTLMFFTCPTDGVRISIEVPSRATDFAKKLNSTWTCIRCENTHVLRDIRSPLGTSVFKNMEEASGYLQKAKDLGIGVVTANIEDSLDKLQPRLKDGIKSSLYEGEKIEKMYSTSGMSIKNTQVLILTDQRVLIGKSGRYAGMHFGKEVTTFNYHEITSVEYRTGPLTGWIEILSPAYPAILNPHFYSNNEANDPWQRPNCVPIHDKKAGSNIVLELRKRVDERKKETRAPSFVVQTDLADQISKLADLLAKGLISEDEFKLAKSKLIN